MQPILKKWKTVVLIIVAQAVLVFGESSLSAQQDTIPLTTDLDLSGIRLVVNSSSEYRKAFLDLAVAAFKRAGLDISVEGNKRSARKSGELMLTVKPEPLNDMCPGKELYAPSLSVVEDIVVPRVGAVIKSGTWSTFKPPHLRQPLTRQELEQQISEFIESFIAHYRLGNPAKPSQESATKGSGQEDRRAESDTMRLDAATSETTLKNLDLTLVNFSLWAGADTRYLQERAIATASKEGMKLASVKTGDGPMLSIKLEYRDFQTGCPGKGMYSAGVELVERVRIKRLSDVYIWATTWSREKTRVSGPPSKEQLQNDSDDLLAQFIAAYMSDNAKRN